MPAITLGRSVYDSVSATGEHDLWTVTLTAGQTYEFRLHGFGIGELPDPFLRLRNPSNVEVAINDDAGSATWDGANSANSRIVYTATVTGTYTIDVGAYNDAGTGQYLLTAVPYNASGMSFTVDEIAWQLVTNGENYFGVPTARFDVGVDNTITVNISGLTAQGQYLAQQALLAWTNVTGITFQVTAGAAEITFDDSDAGTTAYANTSISGNTITSASVMITTGWLSTFGTSLESYSFETYIHEIGHALGLGHGGNYNGSATYGIDNFYLNDSLAYSVMSYMQAANDEFGDPNTSVPASFRYMFTPAIADMVAIQYLYGVQGPLIHGGNTVYGFGSNTGNTALDNAVNSGSSMFFAIFDQGGDDTLNFAGYSGTQFINLASESFSNVLGGSMNVSIGRNVVIENAIGGSGSDTIYGNDVANDIYGGAGSDTIEGRGGDDTLRGGTGNDTLDGGAGVDLADLSDATGNVTVVLDATGGAVVTAAGIDTDTLIAIEYVNSGSGNDVLIGNGVGNALDGGSGDDTLWGSYGADGVGDVLVGGLGDDTYFVFETTDVVQEFVSNPLTGGIDLVYSAVDFTLGANLENLTVFGSSAGLTALTGNGLDNALNAMQYIGGNGLTFTAGDGNDTIFASYYADTLLGGNGNDTLWGSWGADGLADSMSGGDGADIYYVQEALDTIVETNASTAASEADTVYSAIDMTLAANLEYLFIYGNATAATGNSLDNAIIGSYSSLQLTLNGMGGSDYMVGGGGNDTIDGGAQADALFGSGGADTFVFQAGEANGDILLDFDGAGAGALDSLRFVGYGPGATFTQVGATNQWVITYNGGASTETITLSNSASVHATDYLFV